MSNKMHIKLSETRIFPEENEGVDSDVDLDTDNEEEGNSPEDSDNQGEQESVSPEFYEKMINRLFIGSERIVSSTNIFDRMSGALQNIQRGNLPSLNYNVQKMKEQTDLGFGAEKNNQQADSFFQKYRQEKLTIVSNLFVPFISFVEKHFEGITSDGEGVLSNLQDLNQLSEEYAVSDPKAGRISSKSTANVIRRAIKLIDKFSENVKMVTGANKRALQLIPQEMVAGDISDYTKDSIAETYFYIIALRQSLNLFGGNGALSEPAGDQLPSGEGSQTTSSSGTSLGESEAGESNELGEEIDYALFASNLNLIEINGLKSSGGTPDALGSSYVIDYESNLASLSTIFIEAYYGGDLTIGPEELNQINANIINLTEQLVGQGKLLIDEELATLIRDGDVIIELSLDEDSLYYKVIFENYLLEDIDSGSKIITVNNIRAGTESFVSLASNSFYNEINKYSSAVTTSYYEAVSPSGELVAFSPTDLVAGGGKIRDSKGRSFKPKKIKGKSLSSRVNSKSFGKVRKK